MAYTTAAAVKTYTDIESSTDDALLTTLIGAAQQIIDSYTRRTFEASANTIHYFDALSDVAERTLYLDGDLCEINSVTNGDGTTVSSSDYTTQPRNETPYHSIRLKRNSTVYWTYGDDAEDAIQVSGKWAYSTSAPADVVHACNRLVHWLYHQPETGVDLDRALIVGDATVLPTRLPADVIKILAPYRKVI